MPRAPRACPVPGCQNRITHRRYCETHTTYGWTGRSHATGAAHDRWRKAVLTRDKHQCQLRYSTCTGKATEADHIINVKAGGNRTDVTNGQATCTNCHKRKTQAEATAARANTHARR